MYFLKIRHLSSYPEGIKDGKYSIIYGSPEAVTTDPWLTMLTSPWYKEHIILVTVDEAHCVSEW